MRPRPENRALCGRLQSQPGRTWAPAAELMAPSHICNDCPFFCKTALIRPHPSTTTSPPGPGRLGAGPASKGSAGQCVHRQPRAGQGLCCGAQCEAAFPSANVSSGPFQAGTTLSPRVEVCRPQGEGPWERPCAPRVSAPTPRGCGASLVAPSMEPPRTWPRDSAAEKTPGLRTAYLGNRHPYFSVGQKQAAPISLTFWL